MEQDLHRHDLTDRAWEIISPYLPGKLHDRGGTAKDNRQFINAVMWTLRTGSPWRDLPSEYGDWKNTHRRFCRWRDKGVWEALLSVVIDEPDFEWLMIDGTHIKAHRHAAGAEGGSEAIGRTKGGSTQKYTWPWMRMVCRSESLSRRLPWRIAQLLQTF